MKHHHRTRLWTLFAALALGLVVLPTGLASASFVPIDEIYEDTTLSADHMGGIAIKESNVTLDCAGYSIIEDHVSDEGVGVLIEGETGVTVKDCDISGFENGIGMGSADGNVIVGNTSHGNSSNGIALFSSDDNTVTDNVLQDNGLNGVLLIGSTGNTIRDNVATGNGFHGFFLIDADSNTLLENVAANNGENGFDIKDSGNNTLDLNRSTGNPDSGFGVRGSSLSNSLTRNEGHQNGESGFEDETSGGTGPSGITSTYSKNHCTGNGIWASRPSGLCQEERVGLVNPSSGEWHLRHSAGDITTFYYGNPGDVPFMGDWDCNEEATPGLFRQSDAFAYLRNSNTQGIADIRFFFGNPSDIPLAGDFNGDGCDTLSIYRPSEARFYIINKLGENEGGLGAAEYSFLFGNPGDKPVVGDWDGDGVDEIGLHRETTGFFYYRNTLTTGIADGQFFFGDPGDRFVSGDWGVVDGVDTPAMFRPSNNTFYFRWTLTQGNADSEFVWTGAGTNWLPVSGDFTLD